MAELTQQLLQNGQELQTGDVNNMGLNALMDDRLLADILRMAPGTGGAPAKVIVPYGIDFDALSTSSQSSIVIPSGSANGSVNIQPFRAVVGSRVAPGTNALQAWREIRSGVFVGGGGVWSASPPTGLAVAQLLNANSSGNNRWDLIYAICTPDNNQPGVPRAVKAPTTGLVTTPNTVTQLATTISIGYLAGTPSATPALPTIPADGGGVFNIPLAYVLVQNGFSASSTVKSWMVMPATPPPIAGSKGLGAGNAMPANQSNAAGGTVLTTTVVSNWANNSTSSISGRSDAFMPPDMLGFEMIWLIMDLSGATPAAWSHQSGTIVDNSRDWRYRIFRTMWQAGVPSGSSGTTAWARAASPGSNFIPRTNVIGGSSFAWANAYYEDFGQSFISDANQMPGASPASASAVSFVTHTQLANVNASGGGVGLYVDQNTGFLDVFINGTANSCMLFAWIIASRPFGNY